MAAIPRVKVVIVGGSGTGKSSYVGVLEGRDPPDQSLPTLGAECHSLTLKTNDPRYPRVTFDLWDTAGNPRYGGMEGACYAGAQGFLLFRDLSQSPEGVGQGLEYWRAKIGPHMEGVCTLVVGNKRDLVEPGVADQELHHQISCKVDEYYVILQPLEDIAREFFGSPQMELFFP